MDKIIYENMLTDESQQTLIECVTEASEHKNELVLNGWTVCILLEGIVDDGFDYYWRLIEPGEGIVHYSCVGGVEYLKNKLDDDSYKHLYNLFKLNHQSWKYRKLIELEEAHESKKQSFLERFKEIEEILN